jgi:hypothetical protein
MKAVLVLLLVFVSLVPMEQEMVQKRVKIVVRLVLENRVQVDTVAIVTAIVKMN